MIRRLFLPAGKDCLTETRKSDERAPVIIPRSEHTVSRANISKNALKVLYRLKDGGYQAYLVGGGVRDLLLGLRPKDFDIATDARPEEVRALFSNCRLIGRRFRLAHVRFGREIIEVATFRAMGEAQDDEGHVVHESGRILADNVYGTVEQDAWRRDFTINALYYNIADYSVWAFADGLHDLEARCLRLIGEPERRYREDPVRMLRAARFAAKLDFEVHPDAAAPIPGMAALIDGVPAARLFDEFLKMFQFGHAFASYRQLRRLGLFDHLFPQTAGRLAAAEDDHEERMIEQALRNTDQRVREGKPITPMFLFGVFLWPTVEARAAELMARDSNCSEAQALVSASTEISLLQARRIALPRRFSFPMREMLQLQPRFLQMRGKRAMSLLSHRRFRAAFDLMLLRAEVGELDGEIATFWTGIQEQSPQEQRKTLGTSSGRRRRSSSRSRRQGSAP
ncbi:MAG: polynucleotide adenylyltransferase PcnB [Gammaproteobacteria bacterium]|nr:MAG: polynucleotide adenylyltransferase PcnB [Gammaproteobacteria bacterium]